MRSHSVTDGVKTCCMCECEKPVTQFYVSAYTTNQGRRSQRIEPRCKDCSRARRKLNYLKDPEARRAVARQYKRNNPHVIKAINERRRTVLREHHLLSKRASEQRRRTSGAGPQTAAIRRLFAQVLEEARIGDRWLDAYSGDLIVNPTIDHIVPIAEGGEHVYENLCVTSRANNSRKRTASLLRFLGSGSVV